MTRDEVKAMLPELLPQVRERVARTNPQVRAALEETSGVR